MVTFTTSAVVLFSISVALCVALVFLLAHRHGKKHFSIVPVTAAVLAFPSLRKLVVPGDASEHVVSGLQLIMRRSIILERVRHCA